ncbi:MAG: rod shape-determining protein MreC [Acidobacteriota bacterium]
MLHSVHDRRPALLLVALLALLFVVMAVQVRAGGASAAEGFVFRMFSPLVRATSAVTGTLSELWREYVDLRDVRRRDVALRTEVARLSLRLSELDGARLQNARLRSLLDLKEAIAAPSVAATVIGNESVGLSRTIIVDRGSEDGIRPNMPVVATEGTVGRVWIVASHTAKVQLITDSDAGTAVLVQRTRVQGILLGRGSDSCSMEYVSRLDDVQEGDLIVTNGLDGIYPKGLPIGPVRRVGEGPGVLWTIMVKPRVKFNRLEEVLILLTNAIELPEGAAAGADR